MRALGRNEDGMRRAHQAFQKAKGRKNRIETLFEEISAGNFRQLMKDSRFSGSPEFPSWLNESTAGLILEKGENTKDKQETSKAARG